jgi:hypothetical protein
MELLSDIKKLPVGFCKVIYNTKTYGVTRTDFNKGQSIKIFAQELGGTNFISLNYYCTTIAELLKPCEMPKEKVIHFLQNFEILNEG